MGKIIIVCIASGMLAGLSTGFAGLSAAVFITPFLVSFLDVPFFEATGIALASDVFGSLISTFIFKKHHHVRFRKSLPLLIPIVLGCIGGSVASYFITINPVGNDVASYIMIIGSILLGLKFIIWPLQNNTKSRIKEKNQILFSIVFGLIIGFICGFQGAGGGVMILFALTLVLHYEFKNAVGTSVLIMTFTALIGATSHFIIDSIPTWQMLLICIASTGGFAALAAVIANKVSPILLNRITGIMLTLSSITSLIFMFI